MNNYEDEIKLIQKKQPKVADWLDKLDEALKYGEDNKVSIIVKSESLPLFSKVLKEGKDVVDKADFINEIVNCLDDAKFKFDIFSGELTTIIKDNNGNDVKYVFIQHSLKRTGEIYDDLAIKGKLPIKEEPYTGLISEHRLDIDIKKELAMGEPDEGLKRLIELQKNIHNHDFSNVLGFVAAGDYDGEVWVMTCTDYF